MVRSASPQSVAQDSEPLFDEDFMSTLEYLHIIARKILSGQMKAERRSRKKGISVEFADYRPYAAGDDFRFIDWSVYFRTDALFVKLFEEEEDLQVYLFLDCSGSMDFGVPGKFTYARRLAAAIGYLGLASLDCVHVIPFANMPPQGAAATLRIRGKGKVFRLLQFLEQSKAEGLTDMQLALQGFAAGKHKRGLAIIISDLYDPKGVMGAINALRYQKYEPYVIHVISPQEANPELLGDLRLLDAETGRFRDVTLSESLLRKYRETFERFCTSTERFCRSKEIGYARCPTSLPFEEAVVHMLRRGQLLQ